MMNEYIFLFSVALIWVFFAMVQDIRKREVSNWLNFSFLGMVIVYRAFYAIMSEDVNFLIYGLIGIAIFSILGELLYYSGGFGGADVRLLRAFGGLVPAGSYFELYFGSIVLIFVLMCAAALYSLIYSVFLVFKHRKKYRNEFFSIFGKNKHLFLISILFGIICWFIFDFQVWIASFIVILLLPALYSYLKALEACMVVLIPPGKLTEGDWIIDDIKIGGKVIKKSIHGLTMEDIRLLRRHGKSVHVKNGIPFVPVFFIVLLIMVFFYSALLEKAFYLLASFA